MALRRFDAPQDVCSAGAVHVPMNEPVSFLSIAAAAAQVISDGLELVKARLSCLVLVTVAAAFQLASGPVFDWPLFAATLFGALLGAFGANALNQWWELAHDQHMERTRDRPLPSGRMTPRQALAVALLLLLAGGSLLAWRCHPGAALITVAVALAYVLVYTPLKRITPWSLIPGAIVGAAPPLIGWIACTGDLSLGAWTLFGIIFAWQIPHFLAIDWMHREDYGRAGYKMVSGVDTSGRLTGWLTTLTSVLLLGASLAPVAAGLGTWIYGAGAIVLSLGMIALGIALQTQRTTKAARRLFLGSLVYLPVLLALLVLEPK